MSVLPESDLQLIRCISVHCNDQYQSAIKSTEVYTPSGSHSSSKIPPNQSRWDELPYPFIR